MRWTFGARASLAEQGATPYRVMILDASPSIFSFTASFFQGFTSSLDPASEHPSMLSLGS